MNRGIYWKGNIPAGNTVPFYIRHMLFTRLLNVEKIDLHSHNEVEIYLNLSGDVSFLTRNHVYRLSRGDVCVTRPDEQHHCIYHETVPHENIGILFDGSACPEAIAFLFDDLSRNCFFPSPESKEELIDIAFTLLKKNLPDSERQYLFLRMLHLLKNAAREPLESPDKLPKDLVTVLSFVEDHLAEPFTVAEMSKALYISQSSIERRFKEYLHLTPLAYIHKRKMQVAATLLHGGYSVSAAALAVGFADTSYFIRLFERIYSVTPHRYKTLRNKDVVGLPDNLYKPNKKPTMIPRSPFKEKDKPVKIPPSPFDKRE